MKTRKEIKGIMKDALYDEYRAFYHWVAVENADSQVRSRSKIGLIKFLITEMELFGDYEENKIHYEKFFTRAEVVGSQERA